MKSLRVAKQNDLEPGDYCQSMLMELDSADEDRLMALENIRLNKSKVAKAYNKRVSKKEFAEGDLVWKTILPIGNKDPILGKWSPNWEGPLIVSQVIPGRAYRLVNMDGQELDKAINENFLKKYLKYTNGKQIFCTNFYL